MQTPSQNPKNPKKSLNGRWLNPPVVQAHPLWFFAPAALVSTVLRHSPSDGNRNPRGGSQQPQGDVLPRFSVRPWRQQRLSDPSLKGIKAPLIEVRGCYKRRVKMKAHPPQQAHPIFYVNSEGNQ